MTTQISQSTMPAGAAPAASGAGASARAGVGPDDRFAGLLALLHGAVAADGANLPAGGEFLPQGLPFAHDPAAAGAPGEEEIAALVSLLDADTLAGIAAHGGAEDFAARLQALLANADAGAAPRAVVEARLAAANLLTQGSAPMLSPDAQARGGEGLLSLVSDPALVRSDAAQPPALPLMNLTALLRRVAGEHGARSGAELLQGLQGLIARADSVETAAVSTTGAGPLTMTPAQGAERALPGWTLAAPLHQPQQWGEEIGQRIRWMVGNQIQAAELRINPPRLGPVEVRVSMQNDQMNITFLAQHALVRDTLEDAIPRLREMMQQQGFAHVDVDVSQHEAPEGGDPDPDGDALNADARDPQGRPAPAATTAPAWSPLTTSLFDAFA